MKATEFCYWLQGYFELAEQKYINEDQTNMIKKHLDMVFLHDIDKSYPKEEQEKLNTLHNSSNELKMRC